MFYLFAVAAGLCNAVQSASNAALMRGLKNPFLVVFVSLFVSSVVSVAAGVVLRQIGTGQAAPGDVPWWAWFGGLFGAILLLTQPIVVPRLGIGPYIGLLVTASVIGSVLIDNFGALGVPQHVATLPRIAGAALMIVGVVLVAVF
jgi:transporter family-2 protein